MGRAVKARHRQENAKKNAVILSSAFFAERRI